MVKRKQINVCSGGLELDCQCAFDPELCKNCSRGRWLSSIQHDMSAWLMCISVDRSIWHFSNNIFFYIQINSHEVKYSITWIAKARFTDPVLEVIFLFPTKVYRKLGGKDWTKKINREKIIRSLIKEEFECC